MQFTSRAEPGPRVYSAPSEAVKVLRRPPSESTRRPERCRAGSAARVGGRRATVARSRSQTILTASNRTTPTCQNTYSGAEHVRLRPLGHLQSVAGLEPVV